MNITTMINSWKRRWNTDGSKKEFPFYFVQLAPFGYSNMLAAARLRAAQHEVMKNVKQTGMAVTVDLGDMEDIHFTRKKEVGERLALIALAKNYGFKNIVFSGPLNQNVYTKTGKTHVKFDQKLFAANGHIAQGFELGYKMENSDSILFVRAKAIIQDDEVIIQNDKEDEPAAARYAWLNIGEANLINKEGLPAYPFQVMINNGDK